MTFDAAFIRLIDHEGAYSADPRDPGNWTGGRVNAGQLKGTKYGIAANIGPTFWLLLPTRSNGRC
jgi:lysozyme family protein